MRESERDERSGSSQRSEAAHTNHRGLSQEPLAHSCDTDRTAGCQRDQAGRRQSERTASIRAKRLSEKMRGSRLSSRSRSETSRRTAQ